MGEQLCSLNALILLAGVFAKICFLLITVGKGLEHQNRLTICMIPSLGGESTAPLWSVGIYALVWAESQEGGFTLLVQ